MVFSSYRMKIARQFEALLTSGIGFSFINKNNNSFKTMQSDIMLWSSILYTILSVCLFWLVFHAVRSIYLMNGIKWCPDSQLYSIPVISCSIYRLSIDAWALSFIVEQYSINWSHGCHLYLIPGNLPSTYRTPLIKLLNLHAVCNIYCGNWAILHISFQCLILQ